MIAAGAGLERRSAAALAQAAGQRVRLVEVVEAQLDRDRRRPSAAP